jgi:Uri superfamily endonuclease
VSAPAALLIGSKATRQKGATAWDIPAAPGTYALVMPAEAEFEIRAGRLAAVTAPAGIYVYVGSAHGPGGLAARVRRHMTRDKVHHWHIDALTEALRVSLVFYAIGPAREECAWVSRLIMQPGASTPIGGFGSGDCRAGCPAHLIRLTPIRSAGQLSASQALLELVELVQCIQGTERVHIQSFDLSEDRVLSRE